jgi:hypothetical protein
MVWYDVALCGMVRYGTVRYILVWYGDDVVYGMMWYDMVVVIVRCGIIYVVLW